MRNLILSCLLLFSSGLFAQQDSSNLVFGYPDSTKINVTIDLQDPMQDLNSVISGGIGTIGSINGSALAFNLGYYAPINVNSAASFRAVSSFQDFSNSGLLFLEGLGHRSLISKVTKADMKMKLTNSSDKRSEVYYATYPFQVRHQIVLDFGFNLQELKEDLTLNTLQDSGHYLQINNRRFLNGLLGVSYVRTRNVALTVNESQRLHFLTKFNVGANLGLGFSGGADIDKIDLTDTLREVESEDYGTAALSKLGFGFDLGYQFETVKPGWLVSLEVLGRFTPNYRGEAHFYENDIYQNQSDFKYSSNLMVMPSISVGYLLH